MSLYMRTATSADAAIVTRHRRRMFEAMGHTDIEALDKLDAQYLPWIKHKLELQEYIGWFFENENHDVVAGVGLWHHEWMISPGDLTGKQGYVGNVYTHPNYRRQGLARKLMQILVTWSQENGIKTLLLYPSEQGRNLYLSLGFIQKETLVKNLNQ